MFKCTLKTRRACRASSALVGKRETILLGLTEERAETRKDVARRKTSTRECVEGRFSWTAAAVAPVSVNFGQCR